MKNTYHIKELNRKRTVATNKVWN